MPTIIQNSDMSMLIKAATRLLEALAKLCEQTVKEMEKRK